MHLFHLFPLSLSPLLFILILKGYRVFLRSNNEDWKSRETLAEGKDASHTIHGLKCGTKYQVYLLAFNEVGNSEPSESLAFATDGGGRDSFFSLASHAGHKVNLLFYLLSLTVSLVVYLYTVHLMSFPILIFTFPKSNLETVTCAFFSLALNSGFTFHFELEKPETCNRLQLHTSALSFSRVSYFRFCQVK